ncbi:MAG TPA: lytic transglycosylase domain-containing protein [Pyrinomonadaceae bacterium]|nr:lytic transglycosylase domain-containing protein [Pyrinomonadaceae bacterium]
MRKILLISATILASCWSASAQTPASYQVDNFDFANALQIQTPPPVAAPAKKPVPKKLTKLRNYTYTPPAGALVELTSKPINPSLGNFTTGNSTVDAFIVESSKRNSVDPLLIYSIMHQESSFKPRAMSHKGARGLMQLMPATAARFGVTNIWDPKQNIEGGTRYMRFLLDMFAGDVKLALAGYNAGEGAVLKYGYQVPPYNETQEYVRRIGRRYSLIRDPQAAAVVTASPDGKVAQKDPEPLTVYERSVFMSRTPDGRLQLVSQ